MVSSPCTNGVKLLLEDDSETKKAGTFECSYMYTTFDLWEG